VIDETSWWSARPPDLSRWSKSLREKLKWNAEIGITVLGLRPFEGDYSLSEILQPPWATFSGQTEEVDGRLAAVVDIKRRVPSSDHPVYYGRFWIDAERGVVLRIVYFDKDISATDRQPISTIDGLRHQRLSNGGWVPAEGTRTLHFTGYSKVELIRVEMASVTINPADIPGSLFTLNTAPGAW
jgi:hypothetical protein